MTGQPSDNALDVACGLAAERRSQIMALNVIEVPLGRPLDGDLPGEEDAANDELDEARRSETRTASRVLDRLVRARSAGPAIVEEAERRGTEIIVIGTPRKIADGDAARACSGAPSTTCSGTRRAASWSRGGSPTTAPKRRMIWYRALDLRLLGRVRRCIGLALLVRHGAHGGGLVGFVLGALFVALGVGRDPAGAQAWHVKVRGFERVLDAPALFAVAYDEIGSSIYFALGIVAAQALGLTPLVLLATGILFLIVSLSYAEGTAAIPETGGAATFTRRAVQRPRRLHDGVGAASSTT